MQNRFNLIDEPWLPIADVGRVSLTEFFTHPDYRALGGSPVQKIALLKLLLALAQAAATPHDESAWLAMDEQTLAARCLTYLKRWRDAFFLYGEKPFLQVPAIQKAECKSYGTALPDVSTGNTTVLTQTQQEKPLDDADKALLLVAQMGFALSGKKTDNSVVLTSGYPNKTNAKGKPSSAKSGPSVGFMGLLHNFVLGETLWQTLRLNLFTQQDVQQSGLYPGGVGRAIWEEMPTGEDCSIARIHKTTLMGRLVPLSRFCLFTDNGLHYSEGIAHPDYKVGGVDPSIAVDRRAKEPKVLWVNPLRRPWRELTALLGFVESQQNTFDCLQLRVAVRHAKLVSDCFAIWSGGLRVSSNAGEQYVSGDDDYVESVFWLYASELDGEWLANLRGEIDVLNDFSKLLYGCVISYYKEQKVDGKTIAEQATALFWQLCEREAQTLLHACERSQVQQRFQLRRRFADNLHHIFNTQCPQQTARQLDAWAKSRPNLRKYLHLQQEAA